jgi:hypothetical protein
MDQSMPLRCDERILRIHPARTVVIWLVATLAALPAFADEPVNAADWQALFDGHSLAGWRAYRYDGPPIGWVVEDGMLHFPGGTGDDIITVEQWSSFELSLEWKLEPGGNSGIFYLAVTGLDQIYMGAPEYQLLDDARHADGASKLTSTGANYGLDPAPRDVVHAVGEWNETRIVVKGDDVEHWLNGQKIISYTLGSDDWKARVAGSKFAQWPAYGQARRGHIGLQNHGDPVWFRKLRIRSFD